MPMAVPVLHYDNTPADLTMPINLREVRLQIPLIPLDLDVRVHSLPLGHKGILALLPPQ